MQSKRRGSDCSTIVPLPFGARDTSEFPNTSGFGEKPCFQKVKSSSDASTRTPTSFGRTTSDFSTLSPAFAHSPSSDFSTLGGAAFQRVTSDFSTFGSSAAFQRVKSDFSTLGGAAFQRVTSDVTAFTVRKLVSRFSCINDADFDVTEEDEGFCGDEIMNDEDFISHLAGGRQSTEQHYVRPDVGNHTEEGDEGGLVVGSASNAVVATATGPSTEATAMPQNINQNGHDPPAPGAQDSSGSTHNGTSPHASTQESLWQRNAIGGKAAGKRGFIFDPALPSVGTALHFYGGCVPCAYLATEEGCTMGKYCGFCHFCPPIHKHSEYMKSQRRASGKAFEQQMRETRRTLNQLQDEARAKNATNIGSASHFTGACSPCIFIHRAEGCKDGDGCIHCHLCDSNMYRLKKSTRSEVGKRIKTIMRNQRTN